MQNRWPAFKMPNNLLCDKGLSFTARILGISLYCRKNRLNACRKSLKELADFCRLSEGTVEKGLKQLEQRGYLSRRKCSRFHRGRGRRENAKTVYFCAPIKGGFTFVPRSVFQHDLNPSRFLVLLEMYFHTGEREAFPSYTRISKDLHMSRNTAMDSVKELNDRNILYTRSCMKRNGAYSNNSYFFLHQTTGAAAHSPVVPKTRPRVRRLSRARLGILLARRWWPTPAKPIGLPCRSVWPLTRRWKPPFEWGCSQIFRVLLVRLR